MNDFRLCGGLMGIAIALLVVIIATALIYAWDAPHTMQPDCRDANVPYTMQRDPAHEAPREYPEPPR